MQAGKISKALRELSSKGEVGPREIARRVDKSPVHLGRIRHREFGLPVNLIGVRFAWN